MLGEIGKCVYFDAYTRSLYTISSGYASIKLKWRYIQQLYKKQKEELFNSDEYKTFYEENKEWLKPYAVFCFLRDKYHTSDYNLWKEDCVYNSKRIDQYCQPKHKNYEDIAIHFFTQYHLDKQLSDSVKYLHEKGIAIKGDIPIGVNKNSVDVWVQPELFDCSGCAGAHPQGSAPGNPWGAELCPSPGRGPAPA